MRALQVLRGTRSRTCYTPAPRSTNSYHSYYLLAHETPLNARQSAPAVVLLSCARPRMTRQPLTVTLSRWADDWSEVLQAKEAPCLSPLEDGQHQQDEEEQRELLPLQQRMYYCSAAENDEWGTVLSSRAGHPSDQQPAAGGHMQQSQSKAPQLSQQAAACPSDAGPTHCNPRGFASTPSHSVHGAVRYIAVEIGSHCTRAVVHDGQKELVGTGTVSVLHPPYSTSCLVHRDRFCPSLCAALPPLPAVPDRHTQQCDWRSGSPHLRHYARGGARGSATGERTGRAAGRAMRRDAQPAGCAADTGRVAGHHGKSIRGTWTSGF